MSDDYYKTLSVEPTASQAEIKKAADKLSSIWTEKHGLISSKESQILSEIRKASMVLTDPIQKYEYDVRKGFKRNASEQTTMNGCNFIPLKFSESIEALETVKLPGQLDYEKMERSIAAMETLRKIKESSDIKAYSTSDSRIMDEKASFGFSEKNQVVDGLKKVNTDESIRKFQSDDKKWFIPSKKINNPENKEKEEAIDKILLHENQTSKRPGEHYFVVRKKENESENKTSMNNLIDYQEELWKSNDKCDLRNAASESYTTRVLRFKSPDQRNIESEKEFSRVAKDSRLVFNRKDLIRVKNEEQAKYQASETNDEASDKEFPTQHGKGSLFKDKTSITDLKNAKSGEFEDKIIPQIPREKYVSKVPQHKEIDDSILNKGSLEEESGKVEINRIVREPIYFIERKDGKVFVSEEEIKVSVSEKELKTRDIELYNRSFESTPNLDLIRDTINLSKKQYIQKELNGVSTTQKSIPLNQTIKLMDDLIKSDKERFAKKVNDTSESSKTETLSKQSRSVESETLSPIQTHVLRKKTDTSQKEFEVKRADSYQIIKKEKLFAKRKTRSDTSSSIKDDTLGYKSLPVAKVKGKSLSENFYTPERLSDDVFVIPKDSDETLKVHLSIKEKASSSKQDFTIDDEQDSEVLSKEATEIEKDSKIKHVDSYEIIQNQFNRRYTVPDVGKNMEQTFDKHRRSSMPSFPVKSKEFVKISDDVTIIPRESTSKSEEGKSSISPGEKSSSSDFKQDFETDRHMLPKEQDALEKGSEMKHEDSFQITKSRFLSPVSEPDVCKLSEEKFIENRRFSLPFTEEKTESVSEKYKTSARLNDDASVIPSEKEAKVKEHLPKISSREKLTSSYFEQDFEPVMECLGSILETVGSEYEKENSKIFPTSVISHMLPKGQDACLKDIKNVDSYELTKEQFARRHTEPNISELLKDKVSVQRKISLPAIGKESEKVFEKHETSIVINDDVYIIPSKAVTSSKDDISQVPPEEISSISKRDSETGKEQTLEHTSETVTEMTLQEVEPVMECLDSILETIHSEHEKEILKRLSKSSEWDPDRRKADSEKSKITNEDTEESKMKLTEIQKIPPEEERVQKIPPEEELFQKIPPEEERVQKIPPEEELVQKISPEVEPVIECLGFILETIDSEYEKEILKRLAKSELVPEISPEKELVQKILAKELVQKTPPEEEIVHKITPEELVQKIPHEEEIVQKIPPKEEFKAEKEMKVRGYRNGSLMIVLNLETHSTMKEVSDQTYSEIYPLPTHDSSSDLIDSVIKPYLLSSEEEMVSVQFESVSATARIAGIDVVTIYTFGPDTDFIEVFVDGELRMKIINDENQDVYYNQMKQYELPEAVDVAASTVIAANNCTITTEVTSRRKRESIAVYKNDVLLCRTGNTVIEK